MDSLGHHEQSVVIFYDKVEQEKGLQIASDLQIVALVLRDLESRCLQAQLRVWTGTCKKARPMRNVFKLTTMPPAQSSASFSFGLRVLIYLTALAIGSLTLPSLSSFPLSSKYMTVPSQLTPNSLTSEAPNPIRTFLWQGWKDTSLREHPLRAKVRRTDS